MIQLMLLLLGPRYAQRHLRKLLAFAALWLALGLAIMIDALDGALWFPLQAFGVLLLAEGIATVVMAKAGLSLQTRFRYLRGVIGIVIGALVIARHRYSDFTLAMLFGFGFALEGALLIAAAWVVRYRHWRATMAVGVFSLALAVVFFQPYPTHYHGTVPYCIGMWMVVNGLRMIWLYLRNRSALREMAASSPPIEATGTAAGDAVATPLVVHVWTPVGSARGTALRRPVIDRYIAAVDTDGVISTGHAALEAGGLYLSLYPAVEIDRSPDEFARLLRADATNDVPGRYLPSYPEEAASWRESTTQIAFRRYDPAALAAFSRQYRAEEIYNLTNRNCSSTVAEALEAALAGSALRAGNWNDLLRLVSTPETWVAAQIRHRAHTMAWTPGLVLDYARALRVVTHPPVVGWVSLAALVLRRAGRVERP